MAIPTTLLRDLRRTLPLHRRLLAAGLAAAAVAVGIQALEPDPAPTVEVVAAARDLAGGAVLAAADVRTVALPASAVPSGALRSGEVAGRLLASPVRAGEPLTDARVLGPSLLDEYGSGLVAAPVRVADAGALALVRVGDRIDLLATTAAGDQPARTVAAHTPVVALPRPDEAAEGGLLVVAVSPATASELARSAVTSQLSLVLRPP
jgi:Flp pilus assembly protein CpaB